MTKLSPSQEIVRLAFSFIPARAIYVAAKYRLAEVIGDEEKSVDYIAEITGLDPDALGRVCRLLASIGVLQETNDKSFAVTKVGRMLSSNEENSLRDYIILYHESLLQNSSGDSPAWG